MNIQRPTKETDAAFRDGYTFCREDMRPAVEFCANLERDRDEARDELGELKRDLSALLNSLPHGAHDVTEGVVTIRAMREAIKEAYESLNVSTTFGTTPRQDQVRAKLQPFLKP